MHHASLLISILLLFSRHVPAAPSDVGLSEPPGQKAGGGFLQHVDVYGRKIQKRYDDGTWFPPMEPPKGGAQSPAGPPDDKKSDETKPPEADKTKDEPKPTKKDKRDDKKGDHNECRSLKENKYLFRTPLIAAIERFYDYVAENADKQGYDIEDLGTIEARSYGGTADEVIIGPS